MRRGYTEFEGFDPRTAEQAEYYLSMSRIERIGKYHPGQKLHDLYCVEYILNNPSYAFEGIRDFDNAFCDPMEFVELPDTHGICLVGLPDKRSTSLGIQRIPIGYTFAVVATKNLEVWNWYWIQCDPSNAALPNGWAERFETQIWPKN